MNLILLGALIYLVPDAVHAFTRAHPPALTRFLTQVLLSESFQTLVHIGVTAIWILPVFGARPVVRLVWACGSASVHLVLSHWFYYDWVNDVKGIDGGLLGFLMWTVPMIASSLAHDILAGQSDHGRAARTLLAWGAAAMALGYAFSCLNLMTPPNTLREASGSRLTEPPFVPPTRPVNLWTMSQRAGTVFYMTFAAGLSLAL